MSPSVGSSTTCSTRCSRRWSTMPEHGNHLVLAGPGSGKTRVIVHRIAYLLRVLRVHRKGSSRWPSTEAQRSNCGGADRSGGRRRPERDRADLPRDGTCASRASVWLQPIDAGAPVDFGRLLQDAIDLLEGQSDALSDADEQARRLLQGYEYIFVDEYQDIDEQQYALVSALAGRRLADPDAKLSIMAVGDDDQNIYSFKAPASSSSAGSRPTTTAPTHLPGRELPLDAEHHRGGQSCDPARADRMKVDHPIRIDAAPCCRAAGRSMGGAGCRPTRQGAARDGAGRPESAGPGGLRGDRPHPPLRRRTPLSETSRCWPARTARWSRCARCAKIEGVRYEAAHARRVRGAQRVAHALPRRLAVADLLRAGDQSWCRRRTSAVAGPADFAPTPKPLLADIDAAWPNSRHGAARPKIAGAELLDALYEAANDARRSGHADALKLMTAHGAKGWSSGTSS
jgi:ATP-dependent DNA helicase RecQ